MRRGEGTRAAVVAAALAATLLAGCAVLLPETPVARPLFRDPVLTPQAAAASVAIGRDRREDVAARLGPAERLRFDSGWEVWAWRQRDARLAATHPELVILFTPSGVAHKVRLRAGDGPG